MLSRRDFLAVSSAAALQTLPAKRRRPNIVLFVSDDQGFGDLSLHGNPVLKTPSLDRIAQEGAEFTQFHVNPVCSPTRASLLTGRYYYRTGVVDTYLGRSMMFNDEVTIAEVLQKAGYKTGIFGKWHLGDHYPLRPMEQGFEEALVHGGGGIAQPSDPPDGNSYFNPKLMHNGKPEQRNGYCTDVFFNAAMEFISQNKERPFFTYLATNAPHSPLQVDESYVAPFRGKGVDETTAKTYGMLANLDENAGHLLAHLKKEGLEENTILIFMSDNGPTPARFNSGMRGLKGTVYEGGLRVPFFVRWPGTVGSGVKIDRLAAHIDLFPTLLAACGIERAASDPKIDGASLYPLLQSAQTPWPDRTIYFQWHRGERGELYNNCAARNQRYKLVNGRELYDLQEDPAESQNLAAAQPERVAEMRAGYEAWFRDVAATRNFEVPRIYLGAKFENPVLLTRQDWRGPHATWEAGGQGYWEVDVRAADAYECTLLFPEIAADGVAWVSVGGLRAEVKLSTGAKSAALRLNGVEKGPSRVEAGITLQGKPEFGPYYVEVRRV
jgi:arylsulfatase A-like enzyme